MDIFNVLTLVGGLCLFLFGMNLMGQALERRAGGKLRTLLDKMTGSVGAGFLTGLGGCAGAAGAFGRAQSGAGFRPVRVWWTLLAGALWRPCGAGRGCSAGRAGWLSFREKKRLTSYAKAY